MDSLDKDLDDSALYSMSCTQKRKATKYIEGKNSKQAKLTFSGLSPSKSIISKSDVTKTVGENPLSFNDTTGETHPADNNEKKLAESSDNDLKWNDESRSSYFNDKQISSNNCPLCLKSFETDSTYMAHLKQCAKKNKMTTQQLLNALELQKKQMKERRALGLPSSIAPTSKKSVSKRKVSKDLESQCDLALGLALSKSLEQNDSKSSKRYVEVQKSTLKEFGFKSNKELSKKKGKHVRVSVLRERTKEERQRIVTEKAAVVLLDEDQENIKTLKLNGNLRVQNEHLAKFQSKVPRLWNLGDYDGNTYWYVLSVKNMLVSEEENVMKNILAEEGDVEATPSPPEDIQNEISKLRLPKNNVNQDWRKMINNDKLSDIIGRTKDCQTFYTHSLILFVRWPEILEKDYKSVFVKFDLSTIIVFLEFLYCGTLNGLIRSEVENLSNLAARFNYDDLVSVLNLLKVNLASAESSEGVIPSSLTPDPDISVVGNDEKMEAEEVTIIAEDQDLFDDMVDLTQSSHGSTDDKEKLSEDESNVEKSYWSFFQHEKKKEEEDKLRKEEEEKESTEISMEREKIETSMKQRHEMMRQILNEYEEKDSDLKNELKLEKIYQMQRRESSDSATKGFDDHLDVGKKTHSNDDCIVLSSDSEPHEMKTEGISKSPQRIRPSMDSYHEVPYFDPYDNFDHFSEFNFSPVDLKGNVQSQSLVSGDFSSELKRKQTNKDKSFEVQEPKKEIRSVLKEPKYFSTPVTNRHSTLRFNSSAKKSLDKSKKRKNDLAASRIIRKSLGLPLKTRNRTGSAKKKSVKNIKRRNSPRGEKDLAEALANSILNEFISSPMFKSSTPVRNKQFVEVTPCATRDIEFAESVTPSPNYSNMGESVLKEHLSKYGLKKSLGKNKAKKILRYIYEELHPILNTETGKIVKKFPSNTPKPRKKTKSKINERKKENKTAKPKPVKKNCSSPKETVIAKSDMDNSLNELAQFSEGSVDSLNKSTDYDSDESEFGDLNEPLTQSVPNNPVDLPSALSEFLEMNPDFHQKILLYEPIWLEDLQKKLKETFRKHFKLSDLMDYLDQKCITFRSAAQKRNNERKNEKKKSSPRKKKSPTN